MGTGWQVRGKDTTSGTGGRSLVPGTIAESLAARFLENKGLRILARNHRCAGGEIDLVCRDRDAIVFVEVRLRRNADYGGAAASITKSKQRRIALAAEHYLSAHGGWEADCRFDCILLDGLSDTAIEWIRDAFPAA